jgi:hypothetical protein
MSLELRGKSDILAPERKEGARFRAQFGTGQVMALLIAQSDYKIQFYRVG